MTIDELLTLARRLAKDGVVSAEQLLEHDVPPQLMKALRARCRTLVRGVYLLDDVELTPLVRGRVAEAIAGEGCLVSGWLAARFQGLRWVPELSHVTVLIDPKRARRSRAWVRVRRTQTVREMLRVEVKGLPLAAVPWAVIDTAREISKSRDISDLAKLRSVRGVVLGAVLDRRCTVAELLAVLGEGETRHSALARRACRDAERGVLSPPEAEMVDDALSYGVPFYANVEVWVRGAFLGLVDGWLVGVGVGWECDSKEEHAEQERLDRTLARSEAFRVHGAHLAHISPQRYRSEGAEWWDREVFAEVRRRLDQGLGDPPGLELRAPRGPLLHAEASETPYPVPNLSDCVRAVAPPAAAA